MITIRDLTIGDLPALQAAIDADTFHPGEWKVDHFLAAEGKPPCVANVIEDRDGPIAFVRYTKTLRISCVWNDGAATAKNARAIIQGIQDAIQKARASGFTEIIITTKHPKLASFLIRIMGMTQSDGEYVLAV